MVKKEGGTMKDRLHTSFYFFFLQKITCPHKWAVKKYIAFLALNTYFKQPYSPTNLVIASSSSSSLSLFPENSRQGGFYYGPRKSQ